MNKLSVHKSKQILFFGPDGSGKTTLAQLLGQKLVENGFKVKISWIRGTHTLVLLLAFILSKFNNMKGKDNPYFKIKTPKNKSIWQLLEFISAIPIILMKYKIPILFKYIVIGERSYVDLIVWIIITTNDPRFLHSLYSKFILCLAIKGINFYITADMEELMKRRRNEVSEIFMKKQYICYELISRLIPAIKIDTTNADPEESLHRIINKLMDNK